MIKHRVVVNRYQYRADLDALRAIAVIAVVLFHAYPHVLPAGLMGVDVFFVLSGYLMTKLVWNLSTKETIYRFYRQRLQRLYPPLLLFLAVMMAVGTWRLSSLEYSALGYYALSALSFSTNVLLAVDQGVLSDASARNPFLHLWSLAIEAQFYLLWPWLIVKTKPIYRIRSLCCVLLLSLFFVIYLSKTGATNWLFYTPITRVFAMALGGLVAGYELREMVCWPTLKQRGWATLNAAVLMGVLLTGAFWLDPLAAYPNFSTLVVALATAYFLFNPHAWLNHWVSVSPIIYVGRISYSWYLWHWGLFAFFQSAVPLIVLIAMSLGLAMLSYHGLELPLQRRRRAQSGSRLP